MHDQERAAARPDGERSRFNCSWFYGDLTEELAAGRRSYRSNRRSYKATRNADLPR